MNQIVPIRHFRFGRADRIVLGEDAFRYVGKREKTHILQRVAGDFMEDDYRLLSDRQVAAEIEANRLRYDTNYFSREVRMLRARFDTSRIDDLDPVARMHLLWRYEWVREARALIAANGNLGSPKIIRTAASLDDAVTHLLMPMRQWFDEALQEFVPDLRIRDVPAVPSGAALYTWILRYEEAGLQIDGLRDRRELCGRKGQLHQDVLAIIETCVNSYRSATRPKMAEIVRRVHDGISELNEQTGSSHKLTSPRIVRKHIRKLDPFLVDATRHGIDIGIQRHAGVWQGVVVDRLLQRVEMDDWEFDLHVLLCTAEEYRNATPAQRRAFPRIRPTATVAIDAFSRTIVGFHLSPYPPSSAGAITCMRSIAVDKTRLAKAAGCRTDEARAIAMARPNAPAVGEGKLPADSGWSMYGRPETIVTDGGPVFDASFDDIARAFGANRSTPEKDPRLRGRIERWFGTLQSGLLHNYSGRTFSNSVEKGDYDSQREASVTFDELYRDCIRYIVDDYHRAPHTALRGRSPAEFWNATLRMDWKGVPASPTPDELRYSFSVPGTAKPTREGLRVLNLQYQSKDIELFKARIGPAKLRYRLDPNNLNSILVDVPGVFRKDREYSTGPGYVVVPLCGDLPEQIKTAPTLENWKNYSTVLRAFAAEEQEAMRPIRIAARRDLWTGGRKAMERAGVLHRHDFTADMLKRMEARLARKSRNAASNPDDREATHADPDGRLVATPSKDDARKAVANTPKTRRSKEKTSIRRQSLFSPAGGNDTNDIEMD